PGDRLAFAAAVPGVRAAGESGGIPRGIWDPGRGSHVEGAGTTGKDLVGNGMFRQGDNPVNKCGYHLLVSQRPHARREMFIERTAGEERLRSRGPRGMIPGDRGKIGFGWWARSPLSRCRKVFGQWARFTSSSGDGRTSP